MESKISQFYETLSSDGFEFSTLFSEKTKQVFKTLEDCIIRYLPSIPCLFLGEEEGIPKSDNLENTLIGVPFDSCVFEVISDMSKSEIMGESVSDFRFFHFCVKNIEGFEFKSLTRQPSYLVFPLEYWTFKKSKPTANWNGTVLLMYFDANKRFFFDVITSTVLMDNDELSKHYEKHALSFTERHGEALFTGIALLNCNNITTETIPAPEKLNKKRKKHGKTPYLPYRVLKIVVPESKTKQVQAHGPISYRKSPLQHMRRGHIRRLNGPKPLTWVSPCLVGSLASGCPTADYRLIFKKEN